MKFFRPLNRETSNWNNLSKSSDNCLEKGLRAIRFGVFIIYLITFLAWGRPTNYSNTRGETPRIENATQASTQLVYKMRCCKKPKNEPKFVSFVFQQVTKIIFFFAPFEKVININASKLTFCFEFVFLTRWWILKNILHGKNSWKTFFFYYRI